MFFLHCTKNEEPDYMSLLIAIYSTIMDRGLCYVYCSLAVQLYTSEESGLLPWQVLEEGGSRPTLGFNSDDTFGT